VKKGDGRCERGEDEMDERSVKKWRKLGLGAANLLQNAFTARGLDSQPQIVPCHTIENII